MKIIKPHYILQDERIITDHALAFEKCIEKIAPLDELTALYPDAQIITLKEHSLLMPGLINSHVHLEFSANKTQLRYGDFMQWLYSVIEHRESLMSGSGEGGTLEEVMQQACQSMLDSGITTFGAISSHGLDLEVCANAAQNVVYFSELIGSQAVMADTLFGDFLSRLHGAQEIKRDGFFAGVAIHAPYSTHPILIKKALQIVKNQNLKLTAHFMESQAEREWCDKNEGDFVPFFKELLGQERAVCSAEEFLELFDDTPALLTHGQNLVQAELERIAKMGHSIIHCPISNRLLGNATLDLAKLDNMGIDWVIATDGLSSNYTLDLFEEMKMSLFMHPEMELLELAKKLLNAATKRSADALGLNTGEIKEGKNADFLIVDLTSEPNDALALHLILHRYNISRVYINGELKKES